jgi:DNA-binding SARP family transcriptional activator
MRGIPLSVGALEKRAADLARRNIQTQSALTYGFCAYQALLDSDAHGARRYLTLAVKSAHHPANFQPLVAEIFHTPALKKFVAGRTARFSTLMGGLVRLERAQVDPNGDVQRVSNFSAMQTYSLLIWCLGQEHIERDGQPVTSSDWQSVGARDLFYYLVFKGPSTRERIFTVFWPDSDPKLARSSFHTTLYRARQAVGPNVILFERDLYFVNSDVNVWCDGRELVALVQQARLLASKSLHTENLWRRAVDLYNGGFLPSVYTDWAMGCRAVYQEAYLEAVIGLGTAVCARRDWREAINIYRCALQIDPFREDIHRSIMSCYAQQGQRNLLLQHLKDLTELLRRELGVAPSEETLYHARNLLHGSDPASTAQ